MRERGGVPLILPLQRIRPLAPAMPQGPFGALLVTSANAVPFLRSNGAGALPPILTVGEQSAAALARDGFGAEIAGDGTGAGLAERAAALHAASGLPVLYLAGRVRTPALEQALAARAVPFETIAVYDTVPSDPARAEVEAALGGRAADAVLLLSAGQAEAFERLAARMPDLFDPSPVPLCLSARIAAALGASWRAAAILAPRPELSRLLDRYESRESRG